MAPYAPPDPQVLLQLCTLIQNTTAALIESYKTPFDDPLPSKETHDLQRTLISATAMLSSLISDPKIRLIEIAASYFEARALHIVAEKRIPDRLSRDETGVHISTLARKVGIEEDKLGIIPAMS